MNKNIQNSDQFSLKLIEELSKNISNLIHAGDYKKVSELDQLRLKLIKEFNSKNNVEFQSLVSNIRKKNIENIQNIENKFKSLQLNRSKFIKRFKAYMS